ARADVHLAEPLDPGGTAVSRDQTEPPGPADRQVEAERARHRGAQAVGGDDEASPQASLAVLAEGADPDHARVLDEGPEDAHTFADARAVGPGVVEERCIENRSGDAERGPRAGPRRQAVVREEKAVMGCADAHARWPGGIGRPDAVEGAEAFEDLEDTGAEIFGA